MSKLSRTLLAVFAISMPPIAEASVPGIGNFYKVDEHVYRGAQPTAEGFKYLAKLGVKTVLDLRRPGYRSKEEAQLVTALGMHYVNVPMGLTGSLNGRIASVNYRAGSTLFNGIRC